MSDEVVPIDVQEAGVKQPEFRGLLYPNLDKSRDLYLKDSKLASVNFHQGQQTDLNSPDNTGRNLSGPLDTAWFTIKVDWPGKIPPRWNNLLQKTLQSWCNITLSEMVGEICTVRALNLHHKSDYCAEVEITPSKALDTLKKMKTATLNIKALKQTATVHFLLEEKKSESKAQNQIYRVGKTLEEEKVGMDVGAVKNIPNKARTSESTETSEAPMTLSLPVQVYWYLSNVYQKEISKIEKDFAVNFNAEVSVSLSAQDKTKPDSELKAMKRFADLVQRISENLQTLKISQTHLDSDIKQLLFYVTTEKAKMMLNMSADNCQLFGPQPAISLIEKQMNSGSYVRPSKMETDTSDASRSKSRPLKIDFKDTQILLMMDETHWKLMSLAYKEQISYIQQKYELKIEDESFDGSTTVTATSFKKQLESHAIGELLHLYQKVATSAVTCSLKNTDDEDNVKKVLDQIHHQHLCVVSSEQSGSLKLIGLPEHLALAIAEIEKQTGCDMFDDKTKQELVDCFQGNQNELGQRGKGASLWANESDMKYLEQDNSGLNRKPLKGEKTNGKENEGGNEEDDKCPICLDKLTEKQKLKCGHEFCKDCLADSVKSLGKSCPVCKDVFGKLIGKQPDGKMKCHFQRYSLPGFPHCGTIEIDYFIPNGIQTAAHPNPGQRFSGTQRYAYLPDNKEGREVLELLKRAFNQKLIFTVGTSTTTGLNNTVTWTDIHHKTSIGGGPENCGYPDADYFKRVKEELKAKGIE